MHLIRSLNTKNIIYPMQICLLCKGFFADIALVSTFPCMTFFVFPPTTVFAERFHAYATFVHLFRIAGRCNWCSIICLRMMNHSMCSELLFIVKILNIWKIKKK